jgi:hypothetical protein
MASLIERQAQDAAAIKSLRIISTEDVVATRSAAGTRLQLRDKAKPSSGSGGASGSVLCLIGSGSTASGYSITLYADGYDQPLTGTGTLQIIDQAFADNLASGEQYYVDPTTITETGGDD